MDVYGKIVLEKYSYLLNQRNFAIFATSKYNI